MNKNEETYNLDEIKNFFQKSSYITLTIEPINNIASHRTQIGPGGHSILLAKLLSVIAIEPEMLRSIFTPLTELNSKNWKDGELPSKIQSFDELGLFPGTIEFISRLAEIVKKDIKVFYNEETAVNMYKFTALSNSETIKER